VIIRTGGGLVAPEDNSGQTGDLLIRIQDLEYHYLFCNSLAL